jgi:endonuclease YncB( thermonuclease family)
MGNPGASILALVGLVIAGVLVFTAVTDDPAGSSDSRAVVSHVVDGDTVVIDSGQHVRLIGVDTPERGACGYDGATEAMRRMVQGRTVVLVNPDSVQDRDTYGRLLRFVDVGGRDVGLAQIRSGLAVARFDSRDGYDPHPREDRYHRAVRQASLVCAR